MLTGLALTFFLVHFSMSLIEVNQGLGLSQMQQSQSSL